MFKELCYIVDNIIPDINKFTLLNIMATLICFIC
ncbi:MAG: hypothetical protein PWR10_1711 [Halanaerobiales bacterium]|nr:hypothetical protein [Halanaerobiales bacterium]